MPTGKNAPKAGRVRSCSEKIDQLDRNIKSGLSWENEVGLFEKGKTPKRKERKKHLSYNALSVTRNEEKEKEEEEEAPKALVKPT